jgi:hypothetical protein
LPVDLVPFARSSCFGALGVWKEVRANLTSAWFRVERSADRLLIFWLEIELCELYLSKFVWFLCFDPAERKVVPRQGYTH